MRRKKRMKGFIKEAGQMGPKSHAGLHINARYMCVFLILLAKFKLSIRPWHLGMNIHFAKS